MFSNTKEKKLKFLSTQKLNLVRLRFFKSNHENFRLNGREYLSELCDDHKTRKDRIFKYNFNVFTEIF